MRLSHYNGTLQVRCKACGQSKGDRPMFADLDGPAFESYYHAGCLTCVQITEGLRNAERADAESVAADYARNAGRYQGD